MCKLSQSLCTQCQNGARYISPPPAPCLSRLCFATSSPAHPPFFLVVFVDPAARILVPFLLIRTRSHCVINCEVDESRTEYFLNFTTPFEIQDDSVVLTHLGLCGDTSVPTLEQYATQLLSESLNAPPAAAGSASAAAPAPAAASSGAGATTAGGSGGGSGSAASAVASAAVPAAAAPAQSKK